MNKADMCHHYGFYSDSHYYDKGTPERIIMQRIVDFLRVAELMHEIRLQRPRIPRWEMSLIIRKRTLLNWRVIDLTIDSLFELGHDGSKIPYAYWWQSRNDEAFV